MFFLAWLWISFHCAFIGIPWVKIYRDSAINTFVNRQRLLIKNGAQVKMGSWKKAADIVRRWWLRRNEQARGGGGECWALALTFQGVWPLNYLQTTAVEWWSIHLANDRSSHADASPNLTKQTLVSSCSHWSWLEEANSSCNAKRI